MNHKEEGLLYKDECYRIQGAVFEVYKTIGPGFLESVYQECLERELTSRSIPFQAHVDIQINYKGQMLDQYFKADLICYDLIRMRVHTPQLCCGLEFLPGYGRAYNLFLAELTIPRSSAPGFVHYHRVEGLQGDRPNPPGSTHQLPPGDEQKSGLVDQFLCISKG